MRLMPPLPPHLLTRILRRPLKGSGATGEAAVVAALNGGRVTDVEAALATPDRHELAPDFVAAVRRHMATYPASPRGEGSCNAPGQPNDPVPEDPPEPRTKRYALDIPLPVWHECAKEARTTHRSIRRVLADYLLRGYEESRTSRAEVVAARRELREELRETRTAADALTRLVANLPTRRDDHLVATLESHRQILTAICSALAGQGAFPADATQRLRQARWLR